MRQCKKIIFCGRRIPVSWENGAMVALKEKPLPLGSLPQFATIIWKECTRGGGVPIVRIDVYYSELFACSTFVTRQRMRRSHCRYRERVQRASVHLCERNVSSCNYGDKRFDVDSRAHEAFIVERSRIHRGPRRTRSRETRRRAPWIESCWRC